MAKPTCIECGRAVGYRCVCSACESGSPNDGSHLCDVCIAAMIAAIDTFFDETEGGISL